MINYFDASTKPVFKDSKEASYIQFASVRANDPSVNIFCGQLMLSGYARHSYMSKAYAADSLTLS